MPLILPLDKLKQKMLDKSYLEGDFTLSSGKKSNYYFDKYQFESNPDLLYQICWWISHQVPIEFDYFAAMEMGGIPIATMLSQLTSVPVLFVRKEAKEYGTKKLAEGPSYEGKKLCMVEDVITSGSQVISSCNSLKKNGAEVTKVISVILRDEEGLKRLEKNDLMLYTLFRLF